MENLTSLPILRPIISEEKRRADIKVPTYRLNGSIRKQLPNFVQNTGLESKPPSPQLQKRLIIFPKNHFIQENSMALFCTCCIGLMKSTRLVLSMTGTIRTKIPPTI